MSRLVESNTCNTLLQKVVPAFSMLQYISWWDLLTWKWNGMLRSGSRPIINSLPTQAWWCLCSLLFIYVSVRAAVWIWKKSITYFKRFTNVRKINFLVKLIFIAVVRYVRGPESAILTKCTYFIRISNNSHIWQMLQSRFCLLIIYWWCSKQYLLYTVLTRTFEDSALNIEMLFLLFGFTSTKISDKFVVRIIKEGEVRCHS